MKKIVTALGIAAGLSLSMGATASTAGPMEGWAGCNSEYAACLRDGSNMSMAGSVSEAVEQGSSNTSNWVSCNGALAQCYQSLK